MSNILDPGFDLTLRPMKYPEFYRMYKDALKNHWDVSEVDFSTDLIHLRSMSDAERHMIQRLVAFFATGDTIVANNLVLNLYKHINAPEARMYLSRQLFEEALHIEFYLTLLDSYIPNHTERAEAFSAVNNIPSIKKKADFCLKWIDSINQLQELRTKEQRKQFLQNLMCFASCIEGLFFFAAFAYVYYLRSRGLLDGLASGTNWVFRDEACVPQGTEILTEKGFLPIEKVCGTDTKVAQVDSSGCLSWVVSRAWVDKEYKGPLVRFYKDKSLDFLVTPDHDVVTWSNTTHEYKKTKASELNKFGSTKFFPVAASVEKDSSGLTAKERLAIAFQADGSLSKRYDGSRCGTLPVVWKLTKDRKKARLASLLEEVGYVWDDRHHNDVVVFTVKVPVKDAKYLCKDFSWVDLTQYSSSKAENFIKEVAQWDGHSAEDRTCIQYTNTNEAAIDVVHALATLCGYGARKYTREDLRKDSYKDVHNLYVTNRSKVQAHKTQIEELDYSGRVYCPNTPNGTWVMRQNGKTVVTGNCHMNFAFSVVDTIRREEPDLIDDEFEAKIKHMIDEAIDCEHQFSEDVLSQGVAGLTSSDMLQYLQYVADRRLERLGFSTVYNVDNPFSFMELQDVQELTNFFERRVAAYQTGTEGEVGFDDDF